MKKVELIFIPTAGMGHLISTIEFAKRLISIGDDRIWITVLSMKYPFSTTTDAYTKLLSSDRIQLMELPQVDPPSLDPSKSIENYIYTYFKSYIPAVRDAVRNIMALRSKSDSTRVAGLVIDFICTPMIDVAKEFELPAYIYLTTNTAFLGLMLYLPMRHSQNSSEFEVRECEHMIPGMITPVPQSVLPSSLFNKSGGYLAFLKLAERFKDARGIMVNTFEELEPYALACLSNAQNPPIYPVGPVIHLNTVPHPELERDNNIIKWLDDQPQSSVIFLCFGSRGSVDAPQAKQIALGLEHSGCRFLWSLRMPQMVNVPENFQNPNPEQMLPDGFLERIQGKGMICGWAPQVEVLAHNSIGGFVSHCGWNSILESLWFGVPIVTWPMYAEQQLNAFKMVKELGLAVELELDYRKDTSEVVTADEIEKAVGVVMDGGSGSGSGSEVRNKAKEMARKARKAITQGGSSYTAIGRLINDIINNSNN